MLAVVRTGGKQYKVSEGAVLDIERIEGNVGDSITSEDILLVSTDGNVKVGQPTVAGAKVSFEILEQKRGEKLIIFKKIRRHGKRLKKGHRQELTRVRVSSIQG